MINTVIGETLTVGELIEELEKFPKDMPICDYGFMGMTNVSERIWEDSNYPYNLPDTKFIMIE